MAIDEQASLDELIQALVTNNLADFKICELTRGWEIVLSPVWEPLDGKAVRRACLQPRSMRNHYFEGPARAMIESEVGRMVIGAGLTMAGEELPQIIGEMTELYCTPDAPYFVTDTDASTSLAVVSAVIADVARKARVGMTAKDIVACYEGATHPKLVELAHVEAALFAQANDAPVDELVAALARQPRLRMSSPG
jgi:hypothetical protein